MTISKYEKLLPVFILSALVLGVLLGRLCIRFPEAGEYILPTASWLGASFMNLLKVLVIPLVFSSLVSGVMNIGSGRSVGRLGAKTIGFYMLTTLIAVITGLLLVNIIRPGVGASLQAEVPAEALLVDQQSISGLIFNLFPSNIVTSMANNEMLHIIIFAIMFGIFAAHVGNKYRDFLSMLFNSVFEVMMRMTSWVIRLAPLGVLGLVTRELSRHPDLGGIAVSLGLFMLTVILALSFHFFVTLPVMVRFIGRARPYRHMHNMFTPLITAFSTASSSATLPLTMEAVEHKSGVSNRITSFSIPLGATINMDGTALFECVAVIFIAQAYGVDLTVGTQAFIVVTALLTSIGCAAIPMASFVMLVIILSAVGLPLEGLSVILAVDFVLDMLRTTTNVWSDSCVAVLVAKSEGEELNI